MTQRIRTLLQGEFQKAVILQDTLPLNMENIARRMVYFGMTDKVAQEVFNLSPSDIERMDIQNSETIRRARQIILDVNKTSINDPVSIELEIDYLEVLGKVFQLTEQQVLSILD